MKLPSLPENPHLFDVFGRFRTGMEPLFYLHDAILREESPLSPGERELIAAYVSGLNSCNFCYGAHQNMAVAWDVDRAENQVGRINVTVINTAIPTTLIGPINPDGRRNATGRRPPPPTRRGLPVPC